MNDDNASSKSGPVDEVEFENIVRERAYQLWEVAGSPPNASMEFWLRAREIIEAEHSHVGTISPDPPSGSN
jgi:hypothetical protein